MNGIDLSRALKGGNRVYGTLVTSPSPNLPRHLSDVGLDYVFIDTEHIQIDDQGLSWMCQTYAALDLAPIVRIPEPDPYRASKVLDGGAAGIIAPYVETVRQVRDLRGAVKLGPLKGKKLAGVLEGTQTLTDELKTYLQTRNEGKLLLFNVESVHAIENLDRLLAEPDVDGILIGPHDLSVSMSIPEQYEHPAFDEAVHQIIEKARARGIGVGVHFWASLEREIAWGRAGANIFLHSSDVGLFTATLRKDLAEARTTLEG